MNQERKEHALGVFDRADPETRRLTAVRLGCDCALLMASLEMLIELNKSYTNKLEKLGVTVEHVFDSSQQWVEHLTKLGYLPEDHGLKF